MGQLSKLEVVLRLTKTLRRLKALPEKKFNYESFVTRRREHCGTVCCVAGWYPTWFPGAGLKWYLVNGRLDIGTSSVRTTEDSKYSVRALATYHGITEDLVKSLFMGITSYQSIPGTDCQVILRLEKETRATKKQVEELFNIVISLIQADQLKYHRKS